MRWRLPRNSKLFISKWHTGYLPAIVLIIAWLIMQGLLFYRYGLVTSFEARKYIAEANTLLKTGSVSTPNLWLYSAQIFLIAAAMKLKTGLISVAFVQLLLNGWATLYFYKFSLHVSNRWTAFIITLVLILNYPLQTFNTSLQTESLFCSITILFSCYLLQLTNLTIGIFIKVIFFLLLICFTRPTGLLFVPGAFLYLFFYFFKTLSIYLKTVITVIVSIGFLFFLNIALGSGGELDFMLPFRDERIICGVPTIPYVIDMKTADKPNSVFGLAYFIIHNPGQFIHLAWLRSKAFFGLFRTYYSFLHNLYLGAYFFPLYILAALGLRTWIKKNIYLLLYCVSIIAFNWLTVILTCDDWHNRFFLSVVPYIYILAIPFLQKLTDKLKINGYPRIDKS